jgi:hypothetical protein
MTANREPPADRESPVGRPVVRGDAAVTGERAEEAVAFDPDDPESLETAAETVRSFAENTAGAADNVVMLRGAAACAALVRGEGSYRDAAERAGGEASVSFVRKWARVHDLPRSIRQHVALGHIAPSAAKHIARVEGDERLLVAWAAIDHDLTVRQVREVVSRIADGSSVESALAREGATLGALTLTLDADVYRDLHRWTAGIDESPGDVVSAALRAWFAEGEG